MRDENDPKGLIRESYRIEGISASQCRSIFLDWVLSLPAGQESGAAIGAMLSRYGAGAPDHPMTRVLSSAQTEATPRGRRGGRRGRVGNGGSGAR